MQLKLNFYYQVIILTILKCAPKDQFLHFNVEEGWEPLCEFLKVPIPESEFPHKNKKGSITQELMETNPLFIRMQREMTVNCTVLAGLTVFCFYKSLKNRSLLIQSLNKFSL